MLLALACAAPAQELEFRAPASATDKSVPAVMRDLAVRMLPVYQDSNLERFLSNLCAIQMVAGQYEAAYATRQSLIEKRRNTPPRRLPGRALVYDLYVRAKAMEVQSKAPFTETFPLAFRSMVPRLGDREAYELIGWLSNSVAEQRDALQRAFDRKRADHRITMAEALDLIWAYLAYDAYRSFGPLISALDAQESRRRYLTENFLIKTSDGASIAAIIVRPKLLERMPTLLEFSIDEAQNDGKEAASYGYVGVMAYSRGTHGGAGKVEPFANDGEDARTVIAWIVKQEWSNGVVGMYGGGYSGYTAYAAARRAPAALKAIAIADPMAPGIDFPRLGSIYRNSAYRWAFEVTDTKGAGSKIFRDDGQWRAFNLAWYKSGKSYREFASDPGPHTILFNRWLNHPSYDLYWRKMSPTREQFARLKIPVLTTTGYFAARQSGALHYFKAHYQADPRADHTLLIGPYDERSMQYGPAATLKGYQLDQAAVIDLRELRYKWFDHVLKGGPKPALLANRVNYQVMGTNEWRSAPSLQRLGQGSLEFFLEPDPAGNDRNRLLAAKSAETAFLPQTFDLADREDADRWMNTAIVSRRLALRNGEMFVSEPLQEAVALSGAFSGQLDLRVNKMDVDISMSLYELTTNGEYIAMYDPPFDFRASYARGPAQRRLLKAGVRQQLPFRNERVSCRQFRAGSRVVLVLGISKQPDRQINYGTGDDVAVESIEDAKVPLRIRWYNTSSIELPLCGAVAGKERGSDPKNKATNAPSKR